MRIRHDEHAAPRIVPSAPVDMTKTLNARLRALQRRLQEEGATSRALPGGGVRGVGVGRLAGTDGLL
ncbi:AraC family transcriptional regulator, partial [Burkholderia pseudomallei]